MQEELFELGYNLTGLPNCVLSYCHTSIGNVEEATVEMQLNHLVTLTELGVLGRRDVKRELVTQESRNKSIGSLGSNLCVECIHFAMNESRYEVLKPFVEEGEK